MKKKAVIIWLAAALSVSMLSGCAVEKPVQQETTQEETVSEAAGDAAGTEEQAAEDTAASDDTTSGDAEEAVAVEEETVTVAAAGGAMDAAEAMTLLKTSMSDSTDTDSLITFAADLDLTSMFTDRDLAGTYETSGATTITFSNASVTADGDGAEADAATSTVTITKEGTYIISGETDDGQIIVDADDADKVQLVLNGVTITCTDSACIFVKNADKVFVTLADGTTNTLSDTTADWVQPDEGSTVDGVIFARDDIVFNGNGTLVVTGNAHHAIVAKDDVKFTGGTYSLTSSNKGIQANDSIRICGGTFTMNCTDDCLHTDTDDTEGKGYIYICGGNLTLASGDDGIHAATALVITGGTIDVTGSYEGLEGDTIDILGGTINVRASDDGINATGTGSTEDTWNDQEDDRNMDNFDPSQFGPRGNREGNPPEMPDGNFDPSRSDGQEPPELPDGEEPPELPDADDTTDDATLIQTSFGGRGGRGGFGGGRGGFGGGGFGGGMMDSDDTAYLRIFGGNITVNADGDGIDSNGMFYMEGGDVVVYGPTNNGNGALDVGQEAVANGGTIIAIGASGMAEHFTSSSTIGNFIVNFNQTIAAGETVRILDAGGNEIYSTVAPKTFNSVVFASETMGSGTYTVQAGSLSSQVTVN